MARYGETVADGDVYLSNDPHHGGGLHPQDVMVQRPVFVLGVLVAWVVMSAHMMDVGGMVAGSFAPAATECYQEALRCPPVRLFIKGAEVTDVWDIFRNNVRVSALVEMDMRSLVAGCHVATEKLMGVVESMGRDVFVESIKAIRDLSEAEMRRRIGLLADGTYRATSWTEWEDDFYTVPCALTVAGDRLVFDFEGAWPQTDHYFNSKPYIVESEMVAQLAWLMAQRPPLRRRHLRPDRAALPGGLHRQFGRAGADRRRPHGRGPQCRRGRRPVPAPGAGRFARAPRPRAPGRVGHGLRPRPAHLVG